MAQTSFVNVTADPAMSKKTDIADHRHQVVRGTSASGDLTISFDPTKFTTRTQVRSAALAIIASLGEFPL